MIESARELVRNLGTQINLPQLELDEDHYCCVAFDDVVVNFEFEESRAQFLLFAKVGEAPGDASPRFIEEILDLSYAAMLTAGGCLGLDRAAGAIMFADRISIKTLDNYGFEKAIEDFVDRAEGWTKLLSGPDFMRLTADGPKLEEVGSMMRI